MSASPFLVSYFVVINMGQRKPDWFVSDRIIFIVS